MTIEEIKEWRATKPKRGTKEYGYVKRCDLESIIDTLLAEVTTLEKHNASSDQAVVELDQKLTIATSRLAVATEALERIVSATTQRITTARYIARTALERIKE